tara:strand:- start:1853 stop:2236 length:384 start_codon:yes stop_codon:yes gene_type:complete
MHFEKKCMKCDCTGPIEIDHINPISTHPALEFALDNVQYLCRRCNAKKGNRNNIGYEPRTESEVLIDDGSHEWGKDLARILESEKIKFASRKTKNILQEEDLRLSELEIEKYREEHFDWLIDSLERE